MTSQKSTAALSRRQQLIWLENQLAPGLPVNCEVCWLTVHGALDCDTIVEAFRRLCLRHDALRARLVGDATAPRLEFEPAPLVELLLHEIEPGSLRAQLTEFVAHPFDAGGPMLRAGAFSESENLHHVVLNQSHLITDGGSMVLLLEQLGELYEAVREGESAPEPGRQFETRLKEGDDDDDAAVEYWDQLLREPLTRLRPYGVEGRAVRDRVVRTRCLVTDEIADALAQRVSGVGPALSMTAVTAATLHRVSGTESVALGVPILNRVPAVADAAGLFMEVVPNRIGVTPEKTLRQLAADVERFAESARPHRGHTLSSKRGGYEVVLNFWLLEPSRFAHAAASATFTTAMEFFNAPRVDAALDGGTGLNILVFRRPDGRVREIAFDFDSGRWPDAELHTRFADHFMAMLAAFCTDPDQPVGAVELIDKAERECALAVPKGWRPMPKELPNVLDMVQAAARGEPEAPAVSFGEVTLSYREVVDRIAAMAGALVRRGVAPGDLVAVCMQRSELLPIVLLAVHAVGGAYVPLDPMHPSSRLAMIVEDAAPRLLICDTSSDGVASIGAASVTTVEELASDGAAPLTERPPLGEVAYVIFTSGSTGRPKGVRVRHRELSTFLTAMRRRPGMTAKDRLLAVTTVAFDIAALELFLPLVAGGAVHIATYEESLQGELLAKLMTAKGISVFQATPASYRLLLGAGWRNKGVKALCGGEALPDDLAERLIEAAGEVWNMYGPTETTIWSSVEKISRQSLPVTIGRPIDGTHFSIRTVLGALTPPGAPGELNIAGDGVAEGYHGRPDLTAVAFVSNADADDDATARRYRTGDAVRVLPDGRVAYLGRIDFQLKIRGFRVEVGEIEAQIGHVAGVESVAVIPFEDSSGEIALAAYYAGDGSRATADSIRTALVECLPSYMRPSVLQHLDVMPLTPNGKTDRKALPSPDLGAVISPEDEPFAGDLERSVAAAFEATLGRRGLGPGANFFDCGGHSILVLTLLQHLERSTGVLLELGTLFVSPTVREVASRIRSNSVATPSAWVPLQTEGDDTPLFCVCGIELYRPLAEALGSVRPVFSLYVEEEALFMESAARGDVADVSIGSLADAYVATILRNRPEGPYLLTGISFGGLLALEAARRLEDAGHVVARVVLLDTIRLESRQVRKLAYLRGKLKRILKLKPGSAFGRVWRKLTNQVQSDEGYVTAAGANAPDAARLRELAFIQAMATHDSTVRIAAPVTLVQATDWSMWGEGVTFEPDYGWSSALGTTVETIRVTADHLGILKEPAVRAVADELRACLGRDS